MRNIIATYRDYSLCACRAYMYIRIVINVYDRTQRMNCDTLPCFGYNVWNKTWAIEGSIKLSTRLLLLVLVPRCTSSQTLSSEPTSWLEDRPVAKSGRFTALKQRHHDMPPLLHTGALRCTSFFIYWQLTEIVSICSQYMVYACFIFYIHMFTMNPLIHAEIKQTAFAQSVFIATLIFSTHNYCCRIEHSVFRHGFAQLTKRTVRRTAWPLL